MGTASRYFPAFSSSIARSTSGDSVCAEAGRTTHSINPIATPHRNAQCALRTALLRTVDAREVVENRAPLVRRESAQLLPRGGTELDRRACVDLAVRREHVVPRRGRRLSLAG